MKKTITRKYGAIAIGGLRGASGKTIVSMGMIKALSDSGYSVAPFKKGPDYIDPAWHSLSSGKPCHNLDAYLMNQKDIHHSFHTSNGNCDIAVIEGNRGLFDGFDIDGSYSFAELVKDLNIPLILVVDCKKASRTIAALVHGCMTFDPDLSIRGVILNNYAGKRHKDVVKGAIEKYCKIPVLGAIPRINDLPLNERHLGLEPIYEHDNPQNLLLELSNSIKDNIDIPAVIKIAETYPGRKKSLFSFSKKTNKQKKIEKSDQNKVTIGVFKDAAFNFYYEDNLKKLKDCGAEIKFLDSMKDKDLSGIHGLYIGGGFPETHGQKISSNKSMLYEIKQYVENNLPVYAECGGLVYLSQSIEDDNSSYPMCGIFPLRFKLSKKPVGHGYTIFKVSSENPYYPLNTIVKGHEFRYSKILNPDELKNINTAFTMERGKGLDGKVGGLTYKNVLATFCHTHDLTPESSAMTNLISAAVEYKSTSSKSETLGA